MDYLDFFDKFSIDYSKNLQMKNLTTLSLGGPCKIFVKPKNIRQLQQVVDCFNDANMPYKFIGNGSNLLVSDNGYNGAIISTKQLNNITLGDSVISVGSGVTMQYLNGYCLKNEITGFEPFVSIPATLGGAVFMNAGAFGFCASDNLLSVKAFDGKKIALFTKEECEFAYRNSVFHTNKAVVLSCDFRLHKANKDYILDRINCYKKARKETQPIGKSCGSIFKNPTLAPAGLLIDRCGLKGYRVGGVEISNKHANFLSVIGDCTAKDVFDLISYVKNKVLEKFNVKLVEEVEYLGDF